MIYFLWSHLSKNLLTERGHYQNCVKFVDVLNGWSLTLFDSWSCKKWIWIHHSKEHSLFLGGGTVILRLKYMPYTCACAQDGARKRRLSIFGKPTSTDCWVTAHLLAFFASFWYYSPIFFLIPLASREYLVLFLHSSACSEKQESKNSSGILVVQ